MKRIILAILALSGAMVLPAAHAGHVGVSIGVGIPFPGYGYYGPHPYYAPYAPYAYAPYGPYYPGYVAAPPVVVEQAPNTYVERAPVAQAAGPDDSWYYCEKDKAYYPYVKQCAAGWMRVPSRPPQ